MSSHSQSEPSDSEDDPPTLSEHALKALQEFCAEQLVQEQLLTARRETGSGAVNIEEDWVHN